MFIMQSSEFINFDTDTFGNSQIGISFLLHLSWTMYYYIRNLYHWRKLEDLRQLKIKCSNKGKLQDVISCDSEGKLLDKYQLTSLSTQRSGSSKPCSCQKVSMSKLRTSIHYNQQTGLGRTQYKITRFVSWSTPWSRYLV